MLEFMHIHVFRHNTACPANQNYELFIKNASRYSRQPKPEQFQLINHVHSGQSICAGILKVNNKTQEPSR